MPFYEKGDVRIHYEEAGSGFPLMVIPGGGLNSTVAGLASSHPFNPLKEFANEYRVIAADLRNEKITYKIREHSIKKLPYQLIVGDKEKAANLVAVRTRSGEDLGQTTLDAFAARLADEQARMGGAV